MPDGFLGGRTDGGGGGINCFTDDKLIKHKTILQLRSPPFDRGTLVWELENDDGDIHKYIGNL